eukprot:TRINITY_DN647_c0_g1_i23.p1 TRINITY_DN647_c0_g1~~TRINITY_DN647_c0_g1_i23.p1  ORF type:complete len:448 (+),score=93.28 TRINITY_DN647_c0_g1_i23:122-1465(+)
MIDPTSLKGTLRKAKARITMKRNQKLNLILKKKKEILAKLEAGNDTMALINVESLINDERMLPCYDVLSTMCDTMYERVPMLVKMGREIPSDMLTTLHTLLYASNRAGVEELMTIGNAIANICGKKFVSQTEKDEKCVHEVVRENINLITPEEGWKVERLMEIAREVNQPYTPNEKSLMAYKKYMQSKGGILGSLADVPGKFPGPGFGDGSSRIPGTSGIPVQPSMPQPVIPPGPYANLSPSQYPPPASNYPQVPSAHPGYSPMPPAGSNFQQPGNFQQSGNFHQPTNYQQPSVPSNFQQPPANFQHPGSNFNQPPSVSQTPPGYSPGNAPSYPGGFNPSGVPKQTPPANYPPPYQPGPATTPNCTSKILDPGQPPAGNPAPYAVGGPSPSMYSNKDVDLIYPSVGPMPDSVMGGAPTRPDLAPPPPPEPKVSEIDDFEARLANLKK